MTELQKRAREWRKFRKKHFLTQQKLADVLGITARTVYNVEHGRNVQLSTLGKFDTLRRRYAGENTSTAAIGD